jgi:serine phosphatase RsbU (regulator of sigma subunit)/TPR repeat protein
LVDASLFLLKRINIRHFQKIFFCLALLCKTPVFSQDDLRDVAYENVIDAPNDSIKISRLCKNLNISIQKKELAISEQCFDEALLLIEKSNSIPGINNLKISIDQNFTRKGNYKKSLELLFRLKQIADKIKYTKGSSDLLGAIGVLYWRQGDNKNALYFLNEDLKLVKKTNIKYDIASVYNNIGLVYRQMNEFEMARNYYMLSIQLFLETGSTEGLTDAYNNMGVLHEKENDLYKASYYFEKSLQMCQKTKDSIGISIAQGNLGSVNFKLKNFEDSEKYFKSAFGISKRHGDLEGIKEVGEGLSNLYSNLGNGDLALYYYKAFIEARDTLNNEEFKKIALIKEMEFKFDREKERKAILVEADKKRQQLYTTSVVIILFLVLIFSGLLYKRFNLTKKQKTIIENQKIIVEEKQKEITDSILYAKRIQSTLLAHSEFLKQNLPEHFVLFKPKDIVSGDFYWATKKGSRFYLAIGDSTGHGVPGAFMSLLNISFLNEAINEKQIEGPGDVFNHVRKRLIENVSQDGGQDGMDGVLLTIDSSNLNMTYAAANNAPVIIRNSVLLDLDCDKMPVGLGEKKAAFKSFNYALQKGDVIYLYSDGYADQFGGPKGKKFKYKQLNELLIAIHEKPLPEQLEILENSFMKWKGDAEQVDDVCVIAIRV